MHLDVRQYLGFEYKGMHYCFKNLPHCMLDLQHQQAEIVQASKIKGHAHAYSACMMT